MVDMRTSVKYVFHNKKTQEYLHNVYMNNIEISTQKSLAIKIGIHEKTLSRILSGNHYVSVATAKRMLSITHSTDFSDFFDIV